MFFETAHGKSKSDGLGGVVKSYMLAAVVADDAKIRNCQEMLDFCVKELTQVDRCRVGTDGESTLLRNDSR